MSGFTKSVPFTTQFDGDEVRMKLARLSRGDLAKFAPYIETAKESGGVMRFKDSMEMVDVAAQIIPQYVSQFQGLNDADGEPVDLETALEQSYFLPLVSVIIGRLVEVSSPKGEDEKN